MNIDGVHFRAPTTTEAEHESNFCERPKKRNYNQIFYRMPFKSKRLLPLKNEKTGKFKRKQNGEYYYKEQVTNETVPNLEFLFSNGIRFDSHPADWFNLFFPNKRSQKTHPKAVTMDELTAWTNTKALMLNAGVGGGKYSRFINFTKDEIMSHLGLYLLHSISPSPQIDMKFKSVYEDPVNGSNLCHEVFGKQGVTRHKEFKAFFSATDPIKPIPPTNTHPNWKIGPCLKNMMRVSKDCMMIGQNISVDEQDIGFQGQHKDKQRISYKRVGDGFLVDALCADGYTYTWYFRNQLAPKYWIDKGLSPLHSRVMSLFQQLPQNTENYKCGMDNLFMSPKFAKAALNLSGKRVMIHGVCRPSTGVPKCIVQDKVTRKDDVLRSKGTVKAAVLTGDPQCKDLVALSFYDSKPVYFVSNACEKLVWVIKYHHLWHSEKGRKIKVPFYRLSIVEEYNFGMGSVDQADQLRLQYRIHYWIRNRKWWWAIFFWIFECSLTNSYVLYRKFHKIHGRKSPLTHYGFNRAVALAWLKPSTFWSSRFSGVRKHTNGTSVTTDSTIASSIVTRKKQNDIDKKNASLTENTLDPYIGQLRCRLDHSLNHLPSLNDKPESNCQLHYFLVKKKYKAQLMKCQTCNVLLCLHCYKKFHEVPVLKRVRF